MARAGRFRDDARGADGPQAKGTRPVARSRMMGVARAILLLLLVIFAFMAYRARAGH
jgi:hypothetical protein